MTRFILLIVTFTILSGCASKRGPAPSKQEQGVEAGFARVQIGLDAARDGVAKLRGTALNEKQVGYTDIVAKGVSVAAEGSAAMKVECDEAIAQNDAGRKDIVQKLQKWSMMAGVVLAFGVAVIVYMPKSLIGYGIATFGGALVGVFMFQGAVTKYLPLLGAGMVVMALISIGYIAFHRLRDWKRIREQEQKLKVEQKATEELVEVIDATKPRLTEYARKELFGVPGDKKQPGLISGIQSASTKELVAKARETPADRYVGEIETPETPISGAIIGLAGVEVVKGTVSTDT